MSRTTSRRHFDCTIRHDPAFKAAPSHPDPELVEALTVRLRDGDTSVRDLLINLHLKLATVISARLAKPHQVDDAIQEGLTALTEAIGDAETRLKDNSITPYICVCVRGKVREFLAVDRCVFMPGRTFRHKAAKGEIDREGNSDPVLVGVVSTMRLVMSEEREASDPANEDVIDLRRFAQGYVVPEAKPIAPSVELLEVIKLCTETVQEQAFLEMSFEGFTNCEIGAEYGKTPARVGQILNPLKQRIRDYLTA